jgi:hypothetical protein
VKRAADSLSQPLPRPRPAAWRYYTGERGTLTVRRQETFDGTNVVKVELTVNGMTQSCTFDLATKTSTCKRD